MAAPQDIFKPHIGMYYRPGGYTEETVTQAAAKLRDHADVFVGKDNVFSVDASLLQITLEFLVNTLASVSASIIYDALNVFATAAKVRGEDSITTRFRLHHHTETTETTRIQEIFIDVSSNDPESFVRAINCVMSNIDRKDMMLVYNEETDDLDNISGT